MFTKVAIRCAVRAGEISDAEISGALPRTPGYFVKGKPAECVRYLPVIRFASPSPRDHAKPCGGAQDRVVAPAHVEIVRNRGTDGQHHVMVDLSQSGNGREIARRIIETWRIDYNVNRPHTSLDGRTPIEFAQWLRSTRPASRELRKGSTQPVLTKTLQAERNRNGFYT